MGSTTTSSGRASPPEGDDAVEEVVARAWLKAHAHDPLVAGASLPQDYYRDHHTGETLDHEQSGWLTAGHGSLRSSEGHRGLLSYSNLHHELEDKALVGRGQRNREEMDVRVRLDRALLELRQDQRDLLGMAYFEGMHNVAIAEELNVSEAAVRQKMRVAVQDLYVAIARTWNLPYDLADELFGARREGRPVRDREGEQLAAGLAITGFFTSRREVTEDE